MYEFNDWKSFGDTCMKKSFGKLVSTENYYTCMKMTFATIHISSNKNWCIKVNYQKICINYSIYNDGRRTWTDGWYRWCRCCRWWMACADDRCDRRQMVDDLKVSTQTVLRVSTQTMVRVSAIKLLLRQWCGGVSPGQCFSHCWSSRPILKTKMYNLTENNPCKYIPNCLKIDTGILHHIVPVWNMNGV